MRATASSKQVGTRVDNAVLMLKCHHIVREKSDTGNLQFVLSPGRTRPSESLLAASGVKSSWLPPLSRFSSVSRWPRWEPHAHRVFKSLAFIRSVERCPAIGAEVPKVWGLRQLREFADTQLDGRDRCMTGASPNQTLRRIPGLPTRAAKDLWPSELVT